MSDDDFDLIPRARRGTPAGDSGPVDPGLPADPIEPGGGPPRNWTWLITLAVVAFLFFSIGAAIITVRDRLGSDPTPAPTLLVGGTPTGQGVGWLATLVARGTPTATTTLAITTPTPRGTPLPSVTPLPSPSATPSPTPCAVAAFSTEAANYSRSMLGCAVGNVQTIWAAWEPFERGSMLWRSDTNRGYFFTSASQWQVIDAAWSGESVPGRGTPPEGLTQPERGFGWAWSTQDALFQALGWARDSEKGFCADVQEFEQGFYLQSSPVASCTAENLYNSAAAGDWQPLLLAAHEGGAWGGRLGGQSAQAPPLVTTPQNPGGAAGGQAGGATATLAISVDARPAQNGIFRAPRAPAIVLDGSLGEWSGEWSPMSSVVEGSEYGGPRDASGIFQMAYSDEGLLLAAAVMDDRFRPGPPGTDLWQGDALELHVDTQLAQDYADTTANGDDFQLGIGLTGDGSSLQAYRWLPVVAEGIPPLQGAGALTSDGYAIEVLLPWSALGLAEVSGGSSFGFNLSISDNDADAPRQETVVSASPARTTYDNPSEWGTLVLLP